MNKLKKTEIGYYSCCDIFTSKELDKFYQEYFPDENKKCNEKKGYYKVNYSIDELNYKNNELEKIFYVIKDKLENNRLLDIGCGEGYCLKFFHDKNFDVNGIDFTDKALKIHNPNFLNKVFLGDFFEIFNDLCNKNKKYDVIFCMNVLEHIMYPEVLIKNIYDLLNENGILIIKVPNDFSILQNYLIDSKYIDKEFWVCFPDHLNYFNVETLNKFIEKFNFIPIEFFTDFPIDINLLNENTNYIKNKTVGNSCYKSKIEFENLIHNISIPKSIALGRSFADLGIGRNIILIAKKK